ncbi:hypothetical protein [Streptomyces sp. col6]|uniref:RapZ C-terminal domain-containing protein n=1 Tax=Streptomyces sp. col6 TaxID=2478958 RepID=UPI00399004D7
MPVSHDLVTDGLCVDLRRALRNPADDPAMRYRTGLDDDVYQHVLNTSGARDLINRTAVQLHLLVDEVPVGRVARMTVACQGGRHVRSRWQKRWVAGSGRRWAACTEWRSSTTTSTTPCWLPSFLPRPLLPDHLPEDRRTRNGPGPSGPPIR